MGKPTHRKQAATKKPKFLIMLLKLKEDEAHRYDEILIILSLTYSLDLD